MKIKWTLIMLLILTITGCGSEEAQMKRTQVDYPICKNENSIILYDRYSEKLLSYNTETYNVEERSNIQNFMQYEFNSGSDLYTAGNSLTNGFEVIQVKDKEIEVLYTMQDQESEAIFPLASHDGYDLFIVSEYDELGRETDRKVVAYNMDTFIEYPEIEGLISFGAILNDTLYYTVYMDEVTNYALYKIDLKDVHSEPIFLEDGLEVGELYVHGGELFKSSFKKIFSDSKSFERMPLNYFDDSTHALIQIFPTEEANLVLSVINTKTDEVMTRVTNIVDFKIQDESIVVYTLEGIEKIQFHR